MAERTVPTTAGSHREAARESTRARERYLRPPVDIYETQDALVLLADVPGVNKEDLEIRVAEGLLTIQAKASHAPLGEVVYREFEIPGFYRQFELGEEIDQEKISAELKHGVLTLRLPKVERAKPRRIEVTVK